MYYVYCPFLWRKWATNVGLQTRISTTQGQGIVVVRYCGSSQEEVTNIIPSREAGVTLDFCNSRLLARRVMDPYSTKVHATGHLYYVLNVVLSSLICSAARVVFVLSVALEHVREHVLVYNLPSHCHLRTLQLDARSRDLFRSVLL